MEILYVDDDADDISLFVEALQNTDRSIKFTYALSASDALKKLNNYLCTPDIIFIDYHLGGMDGHQCVQHIKQREELRRVTVVVLSANITPVLIDEFNRLGVYHFLSKSAVLTDLETTLKVILDSVPKGEKNPT